MASIVQSSYGKTRVRLMYVDRTQEHHEVRELSVAVFFEGEFDAVYTEGDNTAVLPTDTMKNTVYVLAKQLHWDSIEDLAEGLAAHFLDSLPQVRQVTVEIDQVPWELIAESTSAFTQAGNERRTTRWKVSRSKTHFVSGMKGLQVLKTADSAFAGYLKDRYTTLPETYDRLFGTVLEAEWEYSAGEHVYDELHRRIHKVLLNCFATHNSRSVQHTLFAMGAAVLEQVAPVREIVLVMPNKHCLLYDLARFGLDNPNQVFVPTDEPAGYIEARLARERQE